ncbi:MAG: Yip1 family protein [Oscillochloridaceae bacterium]|nr:YIP1 family protein [Chloroflexaceae bacterium]MDW8388780.1 Yip1 family protein [Oscillochloridaceae bacterium]
MIELFNGALTLNQRLMLGLRESPDVVRRGLLLVLFVGLLVGAVTGASALLDTATPERTVATVREFVEAQKRQIALSPNADQLQPLLRFVNENEEAFYALLKDLIALPTPLPRPFGQVFQWLATTVSTPLSYLAGLLLTVIFTHIAARQLGGQGHIQQMLGLGALSVAPHALDALTFIPGLGPVLGLIAWGWGLVILVVATSVAHRLDSTRATLAVLLYPVLLGLVGVLLFCGLLFVVVSLAGQG